jgi:uncharacterized lipoprotein NlpE involved in copper resistance
MLKTIIAVSAVALTMAGCASAPSSIKPTSVSSSGYAGLSCGQLAQKANALAASYKVAADKQSSARKGDIIGVVLIGLPTSSMSGKDNTAEVARIKGEQAAVSKAKTAKGCK